LYGGAGGGTSTNNAGVVYQVKEVSGVWQQTVIYDFTGGDDGGTPGPLIADSAGNLYGSAGSYGQYNWGLIYELSPSNGSWTQTVLYTFTGGSDGGSPFAKLVRDHSGNLYGTTYTGGDVGQCGWANPFDGCGVVFKLAPPAIQGNPWTQTVLHAFSGSGGDGILPEENGVIFGKSGELYGTTVFGGRGGCVDFMGTTTNCGAVYAVTP
jgi:hypothetical protein